MKLYPKWNMSKYYSTYKYANSNLMEYSGSNP